MGRITCAQAARAIRAREKGATVVSLAQKLGMSDHSLRVWIKRYRGMCAAQIKRSKDQERQILLLNRSLKVLKAQLGLSQQFIRDVVPSRKRRARYAVAYRSKTTLSKSATNRVFSLVRAAGGAVRPITDGDAAIEQMRAYFLRHPGHGLERMIEAGAICGHWSKRELQHLYRENHLRVGERPHAKPSYVARKIPAASRDIWAMDYVMGNLTDGSRFWVLNVIDEFDRRCIASEATKQPNAKHLLRVLNVAVAREGKPKCIRSDHGAQFTGHAYTSWLWQRRIAPLYTGKVPWKDNGLCERLNLTTRKEVIDVFALKEVLEVQFVLDEWRHHYNERRRHGTLGMAPDEYARRAKAACASSRHRSKIQGLH